MRLNVTPEASMIGDTLNTDLRNIKSVLTAGFTTPGGIDQALAAISRLQDNLPAMRRELRAMRAGFRRAA